MAEDLADYLHEMGVRVSYLHSEVDTLERVQILRDLRLGVYDVLVGINLLREGIDLPEVTLVAILDADKEGFLRSAWSLIQVIGRAARNIGGEVVMYADRVTESMQVAIDETDRRRADPGGLQPRARHRAHDDRQGDPRHQRPPARRGRGAGRVRAPDGTRAVRAEPGADRQDGRPAGGRDARGREAARVRARRGAARRDPGHPHPRPRGGRLGGGAEGGRAGRGRGVAAAREHGARSAKPSERAAARDGPASGGAAREVAAESQLEVTSGHRAAGRRGACVAACREGTAADVFPASRTRTRATTRAGWRAGSTDPPGTAASRRTSSSAPARGLDGGVDRPIRTASRLIGEPSRCGSARRA